MEGPWGLPPPVLRNLSLENCKFISQKGPRAEMTSKRTNHFLQSLTELGLGGWGGLGPWQGGLHSDLPTLLSVHSPAQALGQERRSKEWAPGHASGVTAGRVALFKGLVTLGTLEEGQGSVRIPVSGDPPALSL